ncbi:MAG: sporulation initiation factor Spo0A C-terminal domain-containing protein [Lachnospiraceae bacterium]|nr:sporulation initiation factor Spo0A C-terminal domain-containing protein [Lachnospiraceae bacterium]
MKETDGPSEIYDAREIQDVLLSIGVPANLSGFKYITYAVQLILANPEESTIKIVDGLYADVGRKYATKSTRVERCIRHAIVTTWQRGNVEYINYLFKSSINPKRGNPTNTQFLMRLYYYFATK